MKRFIFILILIIFTIPGFSDYWTQKANWPTTGRFLAVSFSINNIGYIGCGFADGYVYNQDFWSYDPITNTWTQLANFAGGLRNGVVGFAIGNKGYVGLGGDPSGGFFTDFYEYDPQFNSWTPKAGFPGDERYGAGYFSIGNTGLVSDGFNFLGYFDDMWSYNAVTNNWTFAGPMPINVIDYCIFNIDSLGYMVMGNSSSQFNDQLWCYDPSLNLWTQKANFPGGLRACASSFSINGSGYVGVGSNSPGILYNDFWKYDPVTNLWNQVSSLPAPGRNCASSWSLNNKGYIIGGKNITGGPSVLTYNDTWEYTPDSTTGVSEEFDVKISSIYPNPASEQVHIIVVDATNRATLQLMDASGRILKTYRLKSSNEFCFDISMLNSGKYFFQVKDGLKSSASGSFIRQ